ncbi:ADP-ribosylation/Crystallin J1 [Mycena sanguinolenta]|nr:ADP-ribosylation/Crystallin J1 [Mycena sanguinolenta]
MAQSLHFQRLPLHVQHLPAADPSTKIRLALLGKALCDALGGPAEFHPRSTFPFVAHMQPNDNFGLPAGVWTDDTSMALALARSIATFDPPGNAHGGRRGGMDAADQLDAYYRWWKHGELSATGHCFDIGNTISAALRLYQNALRAAGAALPRIARDLGGNVFGGNGSLMRVLPVGLAYWRAEDAAVGEHARQSSVTTHPNGVCVEACVVWAQCVARVVRSAAGTGAGTGGTAQMTKLDVLHHFAAFPYTMPALQRALAADVPLPPDAAGDPAAMEAHYTTHHRLLRLVGETLLASLSHPAASEGDDEAAGLEAHILALLPSSATLPSSGYVVDTLVAALYAFLVTSTFEAGALLTANMGNDTDTVAAVYGGLAGAWYAVEDQGDASEDDQRFWSARVREWRDALVRRDVIEKVAEELVVFATSA